MHHTYGTINKEYMTITIRIINIYNIRNSKVLELDS